MHSCPIRRDLRVAQLAIPIAIQGQAQGDGSPCHEYKGAIGCARERRARNTGLIYLIRYTARARNAPRPRCSHAEYQHGVWVTPTWIRRGHVGPDVCDPRCAAIAPLLPSRCTPAGMYASDRYAYMLLPSRCTPSDTHGSAGGPRGQGPRGQSATWTRAWVRHSVPREGLGFVTRFREKGLGSSLASASGRRQGHVVDGQSGGGV